MKNETITKMTYEILNGLTYDISMLANLSAFLYQTIKDINWVGFYLNKNEELLLGPFQGKVACTKIPFTKGVCGACATNQKTIIVDDVDKFKGHIACDSASKSEICIPIILNSKLYGLLDIDSPIVNRFSQEEKALFEEIIHILTCELAKIVDL